MRAALTSSVFALAVFFFFFDLFFFRAGDEVLWWPVERALIVCSECDLSLLFDSLLTCSFFLVSRTSISFSTLTLRDSEWILVILFLKKQTIMTFLAMRLHKIGNHYTSIWHSTPSLLLVYYFATASFGCLFETILHTKYFVSNHLIFWANLTELARSFQTFKDLNHLIGESSASFSWN